MIVKEILGEEEGYGQECKIYVNGKLECSFYDGEPEDNNLSRNFNDCYNIVSLMKRAYEAGKNGENFEVEE